MAACDHVSDDVVNRLRIANDDVAATAAAAAAMSSTNDHAPASHSLQSASIIHGRCEGFVDYSFAPQKTAAVEAKFYCAVWSQRGLKLVADLLARASSLLR